MKTVIVTGAARGLGLAISKLLIDENYFVVGIGRTETEDFKALNKDQRKFYPFDLTNIDGIHGLIQTIAADRKEIYGLVNNAGVGADGVLATQHKSDIKKLLCLNVEAPITLTKYASRFMLKQKAGRIINISSIIASTGFNGLAVYGATKAALEGFTRSLSRELGRANITVNCVAPGYMLTDMTAGLGGAKLESIKRRAPLGLPDVDDAAAAVIYLMSKSAGKTTGSIITVDGGSTA